MAKKKPTQRRNKTTGFAPSLSDAELLKKLVDALNNSGFNPWRPEQPTLPPPRTERLAYTVRIDLLGTRPPIWRRLVVASDVTMEQFHVMIQEAFDWQSYHLHCFEMRRAMDGRFTERLLTKYDIEQEGEKGLAEAEVRLDQVLTKPSDQVQYTYDFGDDWVHRIRLEKAEDWQLGATVVQCVAGRRAAPPEDCGGVYGFAAFLDQAAERDWEADESEDDWDWRMASFNPAHCDLGEINDRLRFAEKSGFADQRFW